jgi:FXSXX-COOH protein
MAANIAYSRTRAGLHAELSDQGSDLVSFSTELIDLTDESLAALRTSSTSVLSHAIRRAVGDAETGSELSAGFNNKF